MRDVIASDILSNVVLQMIMLILGYGLRSLSHLIDICRYYNWSISHTSRGRKSSQGYEPATGIPVLTFLTHRPWNRSSSLALKGVLHPHPKFLPRNLIQVRDQRHRIRFWRKTWLGNELMRITVLRKVKEVIMKIYSRKLSVSIDREGKWKSMKQHQKFSWNIERKKLNGESNISIANRKQRSM